ncbi:actin-like protein 7, putative [Eimeria brunetti]|uniref:Actin-like protein 7, putative n=1 Tax=Eimeria brunetti TaxID=51314 RepID=U6LQH8_9EIME|nr:actin-like protein 7, putative [Eimeria brunetti]
MALAEPVIERGVVRDWEALENLLSLCISSVSERTREGDRDRDRSEGDRQSGLQFLVTIPPLEDIEGKEKLLQILFENFAAEAVALLPRAPLGLFASGQSRGLVVEMGHGLTSAVPVFDCYELQHATFRMLVGGAEVSEAFRKEVEKQHGIKASSLPTALVENAKENMLYVQPDSSAATGCSEQTQTPPALELPDGTIVELGIEARSRPCEVYFEGGGLGVENLAALNCSPALKAQVLADASLPSLITSALRCIDSSVQAALNSQIVFCRGGSLLRGLGERVKTELRRATQDQSVQTGNRGSRGFDSQLPASVSLLFASGRKDAAWLGASMLCTLSTFPSLAIGKQKYSEGKADKPALIDNQIGAP